MKQQAVNTFDGGMVMDIDELHAKPNTLTYARNTEYITTEGNQLILQKREGRDVKVNVTAGYNIKAVEVIDDVAYILSTRTPEETSGTAINTYSGASLTTKTLSTPTMQFGQVYDISIFENLTISGIEFRLKKQNTIDDGTMVVKLYTVNDDDLPDTLLSTSYTGGFTQLGTSFAYEEFTFPVAIDVSMHDRVALVVEVIGSSPLLVQFSNQESTYPSGSMFTGSGAGFFETFEEDGAVRTHLLGTYTSTGKSELGTFPSPKYTDSSGDPLIVTEDTIVDMLDVYSPLRNFKETTSYSDTDEDYNEEFRTTEFNISPGSEIELELQKTYDGSVNMIIASASEGNPVRLINTKFKVNDDSTATLIKRRLGKNDNVYSGDNFQKSEIIPRATTVGYINNMEVLGGGLLPAGGYRYYIKYITADGVETDVIEESRTIDIHYADGLITASGGDEAEVIPNMVKLQLTNLDKSFKGIRVYFSVSAGSSVAATTLYQINNTYDIDSSGNVTILHTGYENTINADAESFNLNYSQIRDSKLITKVNNRLALSGSTASLNHKDEYTELATYLLVTSNTSYDKVNAPTYMATNTSSKTHANPELFYDSGEYWDGETYEFSVVFITAEGTTPAYPIQGIDKVRNASGSYDITKLGNSLNDFDSSTGQNPKGIYRTPTQDSFYRIDSNTSSSTDDVMEFKTTHIQIDTQYFKPVLGNYPEIIGYYFVRKQRKKDIQMRGLLVPTAAIPQVTTFGASNIVHTPTFVNGGYPTRDSILDGGYKRVPAPDNIMPYAQRLVNVSSTAATVTKLFDMQVRAPNSQLAETSGKTSHAIYSPDIDCNTAFAASIFSSRDFGVHVYTVNGAASKAVQSASYGASYNKSGLYIYNRWTGPTANSSSVANSYTALGDLTYVNENTLGAGAGSFAGSTDRNLWLSSFGTSMTGESYTSTYMINQSAAKTLEAWFDTAIDDNETKFAGNALKYGRYIGAKFESLYDSRLAKMHMHRDLTHPANTNINVDNTLFFDNTSSGSANSYFNPNDITGYLCAIYTGASGAPITFTQWKQKYQTDDNSAYFAVSRRYPSSTAAGKLDIGDGDCYSGLMWKRVFRPRGIDEAPQATDTIAYEEDYRDLGMASFGYAISFPAKSNYNFHLRIPSNEDDAEYNIFGQKRSFLPIQGIESIRGSKLDETDRFNHGYGAAHESVIKQYGLNPDSPYYTAEQPNRVYVSDTDIESNFINGFTQFKGLSYRDYNSELGPIRAMVTLNGKIVAVFDSGVATIGVDERSMIPGTEGDIYMDSAKALASKSEVKSTIIGSNQPTSVITTSSFVYGVDTKQYKIWRTNGDEFTSISDLKVQSWLKDTITTLTNDLDENSRFAVYTTYDVRKSELLFTFAVFNRTTGELDDSKSVVYNELLEIWVCETDEHRATMFYINENKFATRPTFESSIFEYDYSHYVNLLNGEPVEETILEFVVNKDQNKVKVLENIMIVGNSVLPDSIDYTTDIYKGRNGIPPLSQTITTRTPVVFMLKENVSITNTSMYGFTFNDSGLSGILNPLTRLPIDAGELVTMINSAGDTVRTKIIRISDDGQDVEFADIVLPDTTIDFYIGHKSNIREYNAEIHEGITYMIPSCEVNSAITQPRGKWIKASMKLDGADQMYISGIASVYNQSLS